MTLRLRFGATALGSGSRAAASALGLALITSLAGCSPETSDSGEPLPPGVIVARHGTATAPAVWPLDSVPALVIASDLAADVNLHAVVGVTRLDDGRLVVANSIGGREFLVYAPSGVLERRLGRWGQGPGEHGFPMGLFRSADTVFLEDNTGRVQAFLADGTFLRSLARPAVGGLGRVQVAGLLDDGSAVLHVLESQPDSTTGDSLRFARVLARRDNEEPVDLVRVPWLRTADVAEDRLRHLLAPIGRIAASRDRICTGLSDRYLVRCFDRSGTEVLRVSRDVPERGFTDIERAQPLANALAANTRYPATEPPPDVRASTEADYRRRTLARHAPVFGQLSLSATGELWVSPFDANAHDLPPLRPPVEPMAWNVFGRDGSWLAEVTLPAGFFPKEFGPDWVVGVGVDTDGTETVQLWRFRRAAR